MSSTLLPVIETLLSFRAGGPLHLGDEAGLHGRALLVSPFMHQRPAHNVADNYQLTAPEIHDNMIMIMIMRQADEEHCCLERLSYINKLDVL